MACRYYDDAIIEKLKRWVPENSSLRVLKPDETKRLFELKADDKADQSFKLPFIALSRDLDVNLNLKTKNSKTYDGLTLSRTEMEILKFNVIPIDITYQLDIYAKKQNECEEYVREFLFKLINNPAIKIEIPYQDTHIEHIANILVDSTVSDTSAISERLFSGQFTRWTIKFSIQDAFLFSIPYRKTWKFIIDGLEISPTLSEDGDLEPIDIQSK